MVLWCIAQIYDLRTVVRGSLQRIYPLPNIRAIHQLTHDFYNIYTNVTDRDAICIIMTSVANLG